MGLLQHATKVVIPGRTFVSRMYSAAARLKRLSYFIRFTRDFHSDLQWWHIFVTHWNGLSLFDCCLPDHRILTDASVLWGYGAVFGTQWLQLAWSNEWSQKDIIAKKLVHIVLSCAVWGSLLHVSGTRVEFRCDNSNVVARLSQQRLLQRANSYASLTMSMVLLSIFLYQNNSLPYPRHIEHCSRKSLKKPIKGLPTIKPPHFQGPCTDPNPSSKNHIS